MSLGDRAEGMARLRRAVAQIEAEADSGGRRPMGERAVRRLSLLRALDAALGGGLADDGLHEIAPAEPQDGRRRWALRSRSPRGSWTGGRRRR